VPFRRPPRLFTPDAKENMRFRYEETDEPQQSIAKDYGIHRKTLDRLARDEGWKLRKDRLPRDIPPAFRIEAEAELALRAKEDALLSQAEVAVSAESSKNGTSLADRLEQAVGQELAAVERKRRVLGVRPESVADGERTARTLASLTDTLNKIKRLRSPDGFAENDIHSDDYDDLPADIDGFRRGLARRIRVFMESRAAGGVSEQREPERGDPTPS
jgi:transposase-like protein